MRKWRPMLLCVVFLVVIAVGSLIVCRGRSGVGRREVPLGRPAVIATVAAEPGPRDSRWATPIERPGVPNLHWVSEDLYRGGQPTAEGFGELSRMGIKTVVNLRSFHSDRDEMGDTDLDYEHITMKAWHPEDKEVVRFLRIVTDPARRPVFVHCRYGADRTGTMCAAYRVVVEGWPVEDAIEEMVEGGFGFHKVWRPVLERYLRGLDYEEIEGRMKAEG